MREAGVKGRRDEEPDPVMRVRVYFLLALLRHYYVTRSPGMCVFVTDCQSLRQSRGAGAWCVDGTVRPKCSK